MVPLHPAGTFGRRRRPARALPRGECSVADTDSPDHHIRQRMDRSIRLPAGDLVGARIGVMGHAGRQLARRRTHAGRSRGRWRVVARRDRAHAPWQLRAPHRQLPVRRGIRSHGRALSRFRLRLAADSHGRRAGQSAQCLGAARRVSFAWGFNGDIRRSWAHFGVHLASRAIFAVAVCAAAWRRSSPGSRCSSSPGWAGRIPTSSPTSPVLPAAQAWATSRRVST